MKTFIIALVAFVAYGTAVPAPLSFHIDVYRNTVQTPSGRIAGGEDARRGQFPYQADIIWSNEGENHQHLCGGTLISNRWVVTAGHCKSLSFGDYEVRLGQLNRNEKHEDVQIFKVRQFIVHPKYPHPGVVAANDIALIELDRDVIITKSVQIAKIGENKHCDAIVNNTLLSGWGYTHFTNPKLPETLQWARLPRISNEQCKAELIEIFGTSAPLDDSMMCTGANSEKPQGSCAKDGGSPLVLEDSGALVGIVSWGVLPCGSISAPSVFTKICSHYDFILEHVTD